MIRWYRSTFLRSVLKAIVVHFVCDSFSLSVP